MDGVPPARPIFVGGTGRSGTTILAKWLGRSSRVATARLPEIRFLTDPAALLDLTASASTTPTDAAAAAFIANLRGPYFENGGPWTVGNLALSRAVSAEELAAAIAAFEDLWPTDRRAAGEALVRGVMDRVAARKNRPAWIDSTPNNAADAYRIHRLLPTAKFLHVVRDGRDVAASVATQRWGPHDFHEALEWWFDRVRFAHRGIKDLPAGFGLTLHLEDFARDARQESFDAVLRFLDLPAEPGLRTFFKKEVSADTGNVGRWRTGLSESDQATAERRYAAMVDALAAEGLRMKDPARSGGATRRWRLRARS